jgi:electron-transferring-flavoprotein dehydrogenase
MKRKNQLFADVLVVGAGPSGLSSAIHLANMLKDNDIQKRIIVVDKGSEVGSHILSGALIKDNALKKLLSEEEFENLPMQGIVNSDKIIKLSADTSYTLPFNLPYMNNIGNKVVSLSQVCRYLGKLAEDKGVEVYPGFSISELIYDDEKIIGVKCTDTGIDTEGKKQKNFQEGTTVFAKLIILAEGTRGSLAKKVKDRFNLRAKSNPQTYSLGIKELWKVKEGKIKEGEVFHTVGYPLNLKDEFGGGFIYGLKDNKVALGFAVGLDYKDPTLDPHGLMQIWKQHSFVKDILKDGSIEEYGAKTIPEGGWNSISKLHVDNLIIIGDSAGFVAMPALKGVHLAVTSGMCAAKCAYEAFENDDFSEASLSRYEDLIRESIIKRDLYPLRNFRAVMSEGLFIGAFKFGIQLITNGFCLLTPNVYQDYRSTKKLSEFKDILFKDKFTDKLKFDKKLTFDKDTSVFFSGTTHDEEQPIHLHVKNMNEFEKSNIKEYGMPSQYFCPAAVYEEHIDKKEIHSLKIHAENCVHCKTCDIKTPNDEITWNVPYGGDGPQYQNM